MDNHIRTLRAARNWTQADLAVHLDVSRQTVNALETGKYDPSLPLAFKIARLFSAPIEQIFIDPEGPPAGNLPVAMPPGWAYQSRNATALNELEILREMGEQGWELTGVGLGVLHFRRTQEAPAPRWLYQRLSGLLSAEQRQELSQQGWTFVDSWLGVAFHYFKRPLA